MAQSADVILPVDSSSSSSSTTPLTPQRIDLNAWTAYNTSIGSVSAGSTHGVLTTLPAGTAYTTPDVAYGIYASIEEALGNDPFSLDQNALIAMFLGSLSIRTTDFVDAWAGLVLYNDGSTGGTAAPGAGMEGTAAVLRYENANNEWMPALMDNSGAGWGLNKTPTSATNADTEAVLVKIFAHQTGVRRSATAAAFTLGGDFVGGTNQNTTDYGENMLDGDYNSIALCFGRESTGGSSVVWEVDASALIYDWTADNEGILP